MSVFSVATDRVMASVPATDRAPVPLGEVFEVSTCRSRSPVVPYPAALDYIFGTVWLLQRGSPESKELGRAGTESDHDQRTGAHAREDSPRWASARGWRGLLFSRSLGLVMGGIFAPLVARTIDHGHGRLQRATAP
jgi:hypothetical protein